MTEKKSILYLVLLIASVIFACPCFSQDPFFHIPTASPATDTTVKSTDTILHKSSDTILRIRNLNPYFTVHVDSTLNYRLEINKDQSHYYWFIKNSPVGLKINKDNGTLSFRADRSYFLSGKLKYDYDYKVNVGVQNLDNPVEHIDTSFTILFFTTEIIHSRLKASVSSPLFIEEGDTINFKIECETGTFPIENISFFSNMPLKNYTEVKRCDDEFKWAPDFDFIKGTDSGKQKLLLLNFVGSDKFFNKDTCMVKIYVRDALNYPVAVTEYHKMAKRFNTYILQLKYAFVQLDKKVKKTKHTRTSFDLTTAATALGGTIFSSSTGSTAQTTGKILPSAGVALVPVKETVSPPMTAEQNSASLVRSAIKRLEYTYTENMLVGGKDMEVEKKTAKLKDELKQTQIQLIDIPIDENTNMTEEQLDAYFNSPKVNKKYRLKDK
ncbi:MAG: hypothetical protein JST47_07100 [Bacteroidetes bacterium]|nr:hypothetical protein [Bacteroidota bacterium]MBS1974126.1 hypothetical protein [Bacteroidota bacterium]